MLTCPSLILTPVSSPPRTLIPSLRSLPSLSIEPELLPATLTQSTVPRLLSASTPLFIRNFLRVDPFLAPATYSFCTFCSSVAELFVKLPFETVLRRAQVSVLKRHHEQQHRESYHMFGQSGGMEPQLKTMVEVGPYRGVVGTLWYIVHEEGTTVSPAESIKIAQQKAYGKRAAVPRSRSKGQGIHGLWRGWRVGFWGLVGVWSAAALGGGSGGEF
jgi:mitochondrial fusion and transport protein UGO1